MYTIHDNVYKQLKKTVQKWYYHRAWMCIHDIMMQCDSVYVVLKKAGGSTSDES